MKKETLVDTVAYMLIELHNYISTRANLNPKKNLLENGELFKSTLTPNEKNTLNLVWSDITTDLNQNLGQNYQANIVRMITAIGDRYFKVPENQDTTASTVGEEIYDEFQQTLKKSFSAMAQDENITRQRNSITQFFAPRRATATATFLRHLATVDVTAINDPHNTTTLQP